MEIKHTIEILTKDIQDIEKLVRNLNNYTSPPQIEIDLAMSRLRHVYDLLSLISRDMKMDGLKGEPSMFSASSQAPQPGQESARKPASASSGETDGNAQVTPPQQDQQARADHQASQPEHIPAPDHSKAQSHAQAQSPAGDQGSEQGQQQTPGQQQPTAPKVSDDQEHASARLQPPAPSEEPAPSKEIKETGTTMEPDQAHKTEPKKASILAEKFASDKSINERIAPGSGTDLSSKLTGEPIDSIKRNVGINDRFLIIRELMDGDNEAFNTLVQQLDTRHHFDEAYSVIQSTFPEQMEHDGVKLLVRLSRRRYLNR
ncbi:MAG: hypothetical protein P1P82_05345 [Bacteroidales bacterium]|nr:hypothetical protein [Bacteroidales bacterium]MDT8430865.1 hypothetical protein [Bacteroidales bacterium]